MSESALAYSSSTVPRSDRERLLVLGMGAFAFGRERRAVRSLSQMTGVEPYFLISKWEDGNVSALLEQHGFAFGTAPFGYLGKARLRWTLVTLLHLPILLFKTVLTFVRRRCRTVLFLDLGALLNALPAVLWLRWVERSRIVFYLGDTPHDRWSSRVMARLVDNLADVVIVNSESVRRGLEQVGVRSVEIAVVYNGVDLSHFEDAAPGAIRQWAGWSDDAILVGLVGQLTRIKGVEDFLDAAELISAADDRCRFVLVGGINDLDPFQLELEEEIFRRDLADRFVITGWMEDVAPVYKALDILVVPSRHEDPAPNTNIEGMASGLPIVATRVGGTPELVADGETAFVVDKASPDQLAGCILMLAGDPLLRQRMGDAGRWRARRLFDASVNAVAVEGHLLEHASVKNLLGV